MINIFKTKEGELKARTTTERRLKQIMINEGIEDPSSITKLTITGTMINDDFKFIHKKMFKTLEEVDLFNATFESSKLKRGAFANCFALTAVNVPNWITEIGDKAFMNCKQLKSFTIPQTVTKIGELAFWNCNSLTSIIIPDSVTELAFRAFNNCFGLTSVTLPNSLVKIGGSAFGNCYNLASIHIPDSVTEIGNGAFAHCTGLKTIKIPNTVTKIGDWVFEGCNIDIILDDDHPEYVYFDGRIMTRAAHQIRFGAEK